MQKLHALTKCQAPVGQFHSCQAVLSVKPKFSDDKSRFFFANRMKTLQMDKDDNG